MEYLILFLQIIILCIIGLFIFGKFLKSNSTHQITLPIEFIRWKQDAQDIILEMDKAGREVVKDIDDKIKIAKGLILDIENKIQFLNKKVIELESKISIKEDKLSRINILTNKENTTENLRQEIIQEGLMDNKYDRINDLASQGWDITDIAKEVQVGKGEVQLILDLNKG